MDAFDDNPNSNEFERAAQKQAEQKPFPNMTSTSARNTSLFLAAALVLPIVGIVLYAFQSLRWTLAFSTTAVLIGVWVAYFLMLHGILKRRRQM
jgi:FtsH-binding integral membrane protein